MSKVFVIDTTKRPVNPVHPGYARKLLKEGKAAVYRRYPFTLILTREIHGEVKPLRCKIDPGSKTSGLAVVDDASGEVVWAAEVSHRGDAITATLKRRRAIRRARRQRKTRYRSPRYDNRRRKVGWLAPSLQSRVETLLAWVKKVRHVCPIAAISQELVRFDTQLLQNPEISGIEYQQGTLAGYELREFLLEKWGRRCAYCQQEGVPLEVEHLIPKSQGGSNRVSNLALACRACNQKKGNLTAEAFGFAHLLRKAKQPLKDAAAVNSTRWALYERLKALGLPVEVGTGGRTKYHRVSQGLPKTHWLDAACVGASTPHPLQVKEVSPLLIQAHGHGNRQMCRVNASGFPRTGPKQAKRINGFQTGDLVKAVVDRGKKLGTYVGRVAVRSTGSFNITTRQGVIQGISHRYCTSLHRSDGYSYQKGGCVSFPDRKVGVCTHEGG